MSKGVQEASPKTELVETSVGLQTQKEVGLYQISQTMEEMNHSLQEISRDIKGLTMRINAIGIRKEYDK